MPPPPAPNDATKKLLAQLWEKSLPVLRERLAQLEAAAEPNRTLSAEARREAANTAHKLAGSLGMFGYPKGTALARELEVLFEGALPVTDSAMSLVERLRAELGLR